MKSFKSIYIIILFVHAAQSRGNVELTNLQCKVLEPNYTEFTRCSLKAVNKDVVEMTVIAKQFKVINNASMILRLRRRGNYKMKPIYQYKIDICEFLRRTRRNPLAEIFYSIFEIAKYSNINHTCPYDHDIALHGCRLNIKALNILTIAQGEYTIYTTWMAYEQPIAEIDLCIKIA